MVCHRRFEETMLRAHLRIRGTVAIGEVVGCENREVDLLPAAVAIHAQVIEGQAKQLPLPLPFKKLLWRFGGNRLLPAVLESGAAAPLLPVCQTMLAGRKMLDSHSDVSPERCFGGIETGEKVMLERGGKEALVQILA